MNIQDQIPFKTYFEVDTIAKYHRVIPMETFMKELAPTVWPEGKRIGMFGATVLHLQYSTEDSPSLGHKLLSLYECENLFSTLIQMPVHVSMKPSPPRRQLALNSSF